MYFKFIYYDHSISIEGKIIFECVANNILEADKMYQEKVGKNPEKQNYVGCSSEKLDATDELARSFNPVVVRIKMEISILELKRERIEEEIKELKIKLCRAEKREKST